MIALVALTAAAASPDIVVTGRSLPQPAGAAAYGAITIDGDRLRSEASGRLEDALRDVAGFQQFRRSDSRAANPTSQGASLRSLGGNAASRALVLLDGVPVADPFAGWIPWPALSPDRLAAARVTRGGGAGGFGSGALTGTIELFSAGTPDETVADATVAAGSRGALSASAGASAALEAGSAMLSGRFDRGDGYRLVPERQRGLVDVPARYRQWSIAARGVAPVGQDSELQVSARAFDDDRRRGLVGGEIASQGADASIRFVSRGDWAWEALAYVQARKFATQILAVNAARTAATPTLDQYNTPSTGVGGKFELRPPVGAAHDVQIGADIRVADGETRERFRFQLGQFTRLRQAGGQSLTLGLYAEDSWQPRDGLTLTAGVRLDHWTLTDGRLRETDIADGAVVTNLNFAKRDGWEPTARGGAELELTAALKARAAGYLGWRLPTLNELYRPFRAGADATAANAALNPERLGGVELGIDYTPLNTARAGLTLFWNRLDNAIGNVTLGTGPGTFPQVGFVAAGGAFRQRLNLDSIRVKGVEVTAALDYGRWSLSGSAALTNARVSASGPAVALDGKRPAQSPKVQASVTIGYTVPDGLRASVTGRYVGDQFEDDLQVRRLRPALTVDLSAVLPIWRGIGLRLAVENLFDREIQAGISDSGIIDRGTPRTIWAGVNWTFGRRQ